MASGQGVPIGPVIVAAIGGTIIYASLTGRSILSAARDVISGKTPPPISTTSANSPPKPIASALGSPGDTTGKFDYSAGSGILAAAKQYIGKPYAWATANPYQGFDCSGLVNWVIGHDLNGPIPGSKLIGGPTFDGKTHGPIVGQWFLTSLCVTVATPAPGDLVIWGPNTHMGIYAGNGQMVDAPDLGQNVKLERVWSPPTPIYRRYVGIESALQSQAGSTKGALS
jgi:cell wall-associated NlpC family hydrolase